MTTQASLLHLHAHFSRPSLAVEERVIVVTFETEQVHLKRFMFDENSLTDPSQQLCQPASGYTRHQVTITLER